MYLFQIFRSFLPMRNPIGFGASDFLVIAIAILLTVLLIACAWLRPLAYEIAKRTSLSMAFLFGLPILLRLCLLAHCPVPVGAGADDFSYLLLGDTLRHFRLANPAHPLHQFFEQVFVLQQPTYASIYPLGQGIVLAFGRVVLQSFWAGVLLSTGALCALCYWMLRAWVPPIWALAGGLLAVIEFGVLNPWVNSYWGGAVSASAGCLVFGALPRLRESAQLRHGALLGLGLGLQILTRPFEALFLATAAAAYLVFAFRRDLITKRKVLFMALSVVLAAVGVTLLQNEAVTRSWTTMPYMLSRYQYGVPATFTLQPNAVPHLPLTPEQDLDYRAQAAIHGPATDNLGSYFRRLAQRFRYLRFFLLPPLYFALIAFIPSLRQRRYVWVAAVILLFALGTDIYPYFFPHYIAAITCLFLLIAVRGLGNLNQILRRDVFLVCCLSFAFWFGLYLYGQRDLLSLDSYQSWNYINWGDPQGRIAVREKLEREPGQQLVFVRYSPAHRFEEWIHNAADIDSAHTVWANDLGTENEQLLRYFAKRKAWLLEPDQHPPALTPYVSESGAFVSVH
jgi:hypothetical protein